MDNGSGKGPLAVERWAKGSKTSTIDTLPDQGGIRTDSADTFLEVRSGKDVLFGTSVSVGPELAAPVKPYLAFFDGTYKLARTAPADHDFPLTREALKGHTDLAAARLAETEEGGGATWWPSCRRSRSGRRW